ncbi:hypothetical protein GGH99_003713 [Coemansia sp. RSA 1285]|nr:hypothetical protein GGH99_003713 [Coemansia sp. RSA 1285]
MVVSRSAHTFNPSTNVYLGTKNEWAAFPTRRFMHAYFDVPSSQTDTDGSDLIDSAGADQTPAKSSTSSDGSVPVNCQSPIQGQHRQQTRGANLITEITPAYVKRILAELEHERAARHRACHKIEALRDEIEYLKEDNSRLEEDKSELEDCLGDLEVENSLLKAELAQARDENSQLVEESEVLREECLALEQPLLDARNECRADDETSLASDSSLDTASGNSMHQAQGLRNCHMALQEETACSLPYTRPHDPLMLRSTLHEMAVAPAMAESVCDQMRRQSNLDDERSGLATPSESGKSKGFFYLGLEHPEALQPETVVATLTPPPTPPQPVFPIYYTGDTLVCLEAETATAKAPAKAVTATKAAAKKAATATKTAAVKAAKSIRKAASAMAHMRFHH